MNKAQMFHQLEWKRLGRREGKGFDGLDPGLCRAVQGLHFVDRIICMCSLMF